MLLNTLLYNPSAILGGTLIGSAVALMLFFLGRITGISGIYWQALTPSQSNPARADGWFSWQRLFIAGLILGAFLAGSIFNINQPEMRESSPWLIVCAGLLVGFGTHLGSGCTSGHGICGIGRLSKRSLVATLLFMLSAIFTVWLNT